MTPLFEDLQESLNQAIDFEKGYDKAKVTNTDEILSRGMGILSQKMGIVDAARFIFLVKTEEFDYTKWRRDLFGDISIVHTLDEIH